MEKPQIDTLPRPTGQQTTRRTALAALLGAVVLQQPGAGEAAKKGRRRKGRRNRQGGKAADLIRVKPISFRILNASPNPVTVDYGDYYPLKCCRVIKSLTVAEGFSEIMGTTNNTGFLWVADRYWVDVTNVPLIPPFVNIAVGGQPPQEPGWCCHPNGTTILDRVSMPDFEVINLTIEGKVFTLVREPDTNYKNFLLVLPREL